MEINWGQVVTHIIGFIIAVLILKRFAWGPILKLLEERREKIQGEFDRIEVEKKGAAGLRAEVESQLRGIEAQARVRIQEGVAEGSRVGDQIKEQARVAAKEQMERARGEIEREHEKAAAALQGAMVDMVVRATENLIRERLDDAKHRELINDFIKDLNRLPAGGGGAR